MNVYLLSNQNSLSSLTKFATVCSSINSLIKNIESHEYDWVLMGDFNCDLCNNSSRAEFILESLPAGFRIVPKDSRHAYIRNNGTLYNIDHFVCSATVSSLDAHVDEGECYYDHLPISLSVSIYFSQSWLPITGSKLDKKWCYKNEWTKIDLRLNISTLAALLSNIKISFSLLCNSIYLPNARSLLNTYCLQIVACLKHAEIAAVPRVRVRLKTPQIKRH